MDNIKKNILGEYFANTLGIAQKVGKKISEEMSSFFEDDSFKNLKIDLLDLLQPFSNASFVIREDDCLKQISTRSLGSGVEIIMTLLLLKALSVGAKNSSIIYLIDEPELHLHPRAQEALAKILLEESKQKQIILSTHSPYMFKELLPYAGLLTLKKQADSSVQIIKEDGAATGLFPWSPSWGEINFKAYDMPTVEFHNELYGYLVELSSCHRTDDFENFLSNQNIQKSKKWKRTNKNNQAVEDDVTLHTFIRHSIHHPENRKNAAYTSGELKASIQEMSDLIRKIKSGTQP